MTLAGWIRRQCSATVERSTITAMVADAVYAQLAGAGFGTPPPRHEGSIRQSAGGLPAIRESVGAQNLENFWVENSVKLRAEQCAERLEPGTRGRCGGTRI
jgi:hypothetical protein